MELIRENLGSHYFKDAISATGLPEHRYQEVIVKELLDNSLDAVDQLDVKAITITSENGLFAICDNGGGIPEDTLENIFDFTCSASSKKNVRTVSRGAQGNALKSVIGRCVNKNIPLYFVTSGKMITYTPDRLRIDMGETCNIFAKLVEPTDQANGIYLGSGISEYTLFAYLSGIQTVNPDVCFTVNGNIYGAFTEPKKLSSVHSILWHTVASFKNLLRLMATNYPEKTTKQFLADFSGTQRIVSTISLPGKLLSDFYTSDQDIENLFLAVRSATAPVRPSILEKYAIDRTAAQALRGDDFVGYKKTASSYTSDQAEIPILIEAVLSKTGNAKNKITTCINNSKNYEAIPFRFSPGTRCEIAGQAWRTDSLDALINATGFTTGTGYQLLLHTVSPHFEYFDKAKSQINSDGFKDELLAVIDPLITPIVKAIKRQERGLKAIPERCEKKISKLSLMFEYFEEGAKQATGDWLYTSQARQAFYVVRRLASNYHGIVLTGASDYDTFTQTVCTTKFEEKPELEKFILFERRGYYLDSDTGEEITMNTQSSNDFIAAMNQRNECKTETIHGNYSPTRHIIQYPYDLAVSAILFVEKQGFCEVLDKSGVTGELGLSIMASQGFATRSMKRTIKSAISRGIPVYSLHDCDLAGQIIGEKLSGGSNTFKDTLDVINIGLCFDDAKALGKLPDAEEYESTKSYLNVLEAMTPAERSFFLKGSKTTPDGKEVFTYRRVELNALTMPEFINFIRAKIPKRQLKPTPDQLRQLVTVNAEALKRDAITEYLLAQVDDYMTQISGHDVNLDATKIADEIYHALGNGRATERWQDVHRDIVDGYQRQVMDTLRERITTLVWQ